MAIAVPKDPTFIETMQVLVVNGGLRLVAAIIILAAGWTLAGYVKRWLEAGLRHLPLDLTLKPLIAQLMRYAVLIVTLILVLEQFGVQTTSLIAVIGAAGLAIGLAIQGTLSNVAAGVMLLILRPLRVGHFVQAGGQSGTVREIGLFTTIMVTRDLIYISIPNAAIFGSIIINYTRERLRRVSFAVPVDYANDLALVEKTMLEAIAGNPLALKDPPPRAVVTALQEYAVVMTAYVFVRSPDYWTALPALQRAVKDALTRANILVAVTRQAAAIRNEKLTAVTAPDSPTQALPGEEDGEDAPERAVLGH